VPLSENEQRLLDQIERALYAEDPKFASTVRTSDLKTHLLRRIRRAAALLTVGLITLVVGVAASLVAVGVAGFVVMLVAGLVIARSLTRMSGREVSGLRSTRSRSSSPRRSRKTSRPVEPGERGGLLGRVEERWKRRWDERD